MRKSRIIWEKVGKIKQFLIKNRKSRKVEEVQVQFISHYLTKKYYIGRDTHA
jgi:hypothetical protein